MNIHGLKCDAPSCDYNDPSIPFEQYEENVDAPCPKCGASLLTPEDYEAVLAIKRVFDSISPALTPKEDEEEVRVRFEFNGTGIPDIKIEEV